METGQLQSQKARWTMSDSAQNQPSWKCSARNEAICRQTCGWRQIADARLVIYLDRDGAALDYRVLRSIGSGDWDDIVSGGE
jgi:hypothetical protein